MDKNKEKAPSSTFRAIWLLYLTLFYCTGVLTANVENLLSFLFGTTEFGIGFSIAMFYIVCIISSLFFGYFCDKISKKIPRKWLFFLTNSIWILGYGLASLAINYYFYLTYICIAAIGSGAFLPIGYSIIGDFYPPKDRAKKYGMMQVSIALGIGIGVILGGILGSYLRALGWRYAYGVGFILGLISLLLFGVKGVNPKRASSEPEFEDLQGSIEYDYKITLDNLFSLFKKKSILSVLLYVLCQGIAISTIALWGIFYLEMKITISGSQLYASILYLISGAGGLPGVIIGGRLGDKYYNLGKLRGRVIISFIGVILGSLFLLGFYLLPFFTGNLTEVIFSWILFIFLGFMGYFFINLSIGNQFAIYSEVCTPEVRNTANAFNSVMVNIGAIIGNLVLSSLIQQNILLLPFSYSLVLLINLFGAAFWIITYFYYPQEAEEFRELMRKRRLEIEDKNK